MAEPKFKPAQPPTAKALISKAEVQIGDGPRPESKLSLWIKGEAAGSLHVSWKDLWDVLDRLTTGNTEVNFTRLSAPEGKEKSFSLPVGKAIEAWRRMH